MKPVDSKTDIEDERDTIADVGSVQDTATRGMHEE